MSLLFLSPQRGNRRANQSPSQVRITTEHLESFLLFLLSLDIDHGARSLFHWFVEVEKSCLPKCSLHKLGHISLSWKKKEIPTILHSGYGHLIFQLQFYITFLLFSINCFFCVAHTEWLGLISLLFPVFHDLSFSPNLLSPTTRINWEQQTLTSFVTFRQCDHVPLYECGLGSYL